MSTDPPDALQYRDTSKGDHLADLDTIFNYTTSRWDWHEGNVNQMWIQEIEESPDFYRYIAVAYNPRKNVSTVVSEPRCYADTLNWVRMYCGNFCILPEYCY
jgi:hypothetical protein